MRTSGRLVGVVCVVLSAIGLFCCALSVNTPLQSGQPPISAESVTEISMERRCFGCDREFKVTLKRDGTATRAVFGNARQGTVDRQMAAVVTPAAFDDLARFIAAQGFDQLLDEYRDPRVADGEWVVTTVTAGARQKSVLDRNGTAPATLQRIQARIEGVVATLSWKE